MDSIDTIVGKTLNARHKLYALTQADSVMRYTTFSVCLDIKQQKKIDALEGNDEEVGMLLVKWYVDGELSVGEEVDVSYDDDYTMEDLIYEAE